MMIEAVKLLREGIIGDVLVAKCWNIQRRGPLPPARTPTPPAGFDYDNWVGPATMIPYRTNRVHNAGRCGITSAPATWATTACTTSTTRAGAWASRRIPPRSRHSAASTSSTTTRSSPTRSK